MIDSADKICFKMPHTVSPVKIKNMQQFVPGIEALSEDEAELEELRNIIDYDDDGCPSRSRRRRQNQTCFRSRPSNIYKPFKLSEVALDGENESRLQELNASGKVLFTFI